MSSSKRKQRPREHEESGIGVVVVARRKALELTREKLANESGLSVRALALIEANKTTDPKLSTVRKLAIALRMKACELIRASA